MAVSPQVQQFPMRPAAPALPARLRRLVRKKPVGAVAFFIILALAIAAIASPLLAPYDPLEPNYNALRQEPSFAHPFGTDQIGRDLLSRIIYGTRISFLVGVVSVGVAVCIGTPIGLIAGYFRGPTDELLMRIIDAISAFPSLVLALAIVAVLEPSLLNVMVAVGVTSVPIFARLTRSQVLSLRERDFVLAATSTGASDTRIMLRHIMPNAASPLIVQATLGLGIAILAEASLGYLGVGVQPPTPTWGGILNQGAPLIERAPWLSIAPGVAIFTLVLCFNLVGDALRDALDPRQRKG
ncbi:MAG TPA: ABC transporter permease [Tepidiformaceae bacterium]|nr:ABC transporter permease [Tepidiformaceae bacterium]